MSTTDWDKAIEACRPRLDAELGTNRTVLACGNKAFQYLTGKGQITNWMGAPLPSLQGHTVLPSIHPAFALRKPAYIPVFKEFLRRAAALVQGVLPAWSWPELVTKGPYAPALKRLAASPSLSIDIENFPDTGRIRTIGVGNSSLAVSVPIPPDGDANEDDLRELRLLLANGALKVLHNSQFDLLELEANGWEVRGPVYDTILAHAVVAPQLPHDLSFVAASEYHAPRWKTEFKVIGEDKGKKAAAFSGPLGALQPYNAKDVVMTAKLHERLEHRITKIHNGRELLDEYHELNGISMKMKRWGIYVEKSNLDKHQADLAQLLSDLNRRFKELVPDDAFTLGANGQHPSIAKLFFDKFQLPTVSWSKDTGMPSLDGKALTSYVGTYSTTMPLVADIGRVVLAFRKFSKLKGSYVDTLPVFEDGCVHPTWRIFGARTGRWSATDPAFQTIPREVLYKLPDGRLINMQLRNLFRARPGYVMVEADYSQLEVRIAAYLSEDEPLLDCYERGEDVYVDTARRIWAKEWSSFDEKALKLRRYLAKKVVLGKNYGAGPETIWRSIIVEVPGIQLAAVEHVVAGYEKVHRQLAEWQAKTIAETQRQGFVQEDLSGRRQHYHDGKVPPTEPPNFKIQGAAGTIANRAVKFIARELNWTDEALLAQVHDATMSECVESKKNRLIDIVREGMGQEVTLGRHRVRIPVDLKVGTNWATLEKAA
jgi:DNA polymerase I